jgi:hypothetical protein
MLIPAAPQPLRAAPAAIAAKSAANQSVAPRSSLALASSSTQQPLRITAVQPVVREAIQRFSRLGITPVQQAKLAAVEVKIADLPGDELGSTTGNQITLDTTAAELGWFIDPTPDNDSEFAGGVSAPEGIDLFTVISHELGHVLGLEHDVLAGDDLQDEFLNVGVRKSPTPELIDQLLAQDDAWEIED